MGNIPDMTPQERRDKLVDWLRNLPMGKPFTSTEASVQVYGDRSFSSYVSSVMESLIKKNCVVAIGKRSTGRSGAAIIYIITDDIPDWRVICKGPYVRKSGYIRRSNLPYLPVVGSEGYVNAKSAAPTLLHERLFQLALDAEAGKNVLPDLSMLLADELNKKD